MTGRANLTVTISDEMAGRLGDIAKRDASTADQVIAQALEQYLDQEMHIKAAIERGRADLVAGRVFTQAAMISEIAEIVNSART